MGLSSIQLDAFVAVTQTLNFTKAAKKLHVTQSALSQRILNLEQELQVTLFIRDRAGLKLTETALELVRYCQSKNNLEDEFISKLQSKDEGLAGVLRIGAFSSVMRSVVLPSISNIVKKNPKFKIQLLTKEMDELPNALKRGEIDYMILDQKIDKDELERIQMGFEHNVLVGKKNYKGAEIYLDHDEHDPVTYEYFKNAKRKNQKLERHYLGDVYGLLDGVRNGLGMAILPKHLIKDIKEIEIIDPHLVLKAPVSLYFYKQPFYSSLHSAVVSEIITNSRTILSA